MSSSVLKEDSWNDSPINERKDELVRAMKASTGEGPGRFLKEIRELKSLSLMDVASRINIGIAQVKALEEEQFDQLPAPIYVRGYLKRYAEVLEIPSQSVVEAWERVGEPSPPPLKRVTLREKISNRTVSVRWATYTALALFVFLVFLWSRTIDDKKNIQIGKEAVTPNLQDSITSDIRLPQPPVFNPGTSNLPEKSPE